MKYVSSLPCSSKWTIKVCVYVSMSSTDTGSTYTEVMSSDGTNDVKEILQHHCNRKDANGLKANKRFGFVKSETLFHK